MLLTCHAQFPSKEVKELEDQLIRIQEHLHEEGISHEGQTAEEAYAERLAQIHLDDGAVLEGNQVVKALLARCILWVEVIQEKYVPLQTLSKTNLTSSFRQGKIEERFQDTYDKLVKVRNTLEQMNLTQAWSLRETDLYSYQRQLDRIDESRINGNFIDAEGRPADLHAQRVSLLAQYSLLHVLAHLTFHRHSSTFCANHTPLSTNTLSLLNLFPKPYCLFTTSF